MRQDEGVRLEQAFARSYLSGEGTEEERDAWERRLLEDDGALMAYLESMDKLEGHFPLLDSPGDFVDKVMVSLSAENGHSQRSGEAAPLEEGQRRGRWYEKAIFHYVIAASLTLFFLSSGVFDRLLTGEMSLFIPEGKHLSYSEQMMKATSGWLDQLMHGYRK
jgi:hypothetical protein